MTRISIVALLFVVASCTPEPTHIGNSTLPASTKLSGQQLFETHCKLCHGSDGKLELNGAKDLNLSQLTLEERMIMVSNGKNAMTPFKNILTEEEIQRVARYTLKFSTNK